MIWTLWKNKLPGPPFRPLSQSGLFRDLLAGRPHLDVLNLTCYETLLLCTASPIPAPPLFLDSSQCTGMPCSALRDRFTLFFLFAFSNLCPRLLEGCSLEWVFFFLLFLTFSTASLLVFPPVDRLLHTTDCFFYYLVQLVFLEPPYCNFMLPSNLNALIYHTLRGALLVPSVHDPVPPCPSFVSSYFSEPFLYMILLLCVDPLEGRAWSPRRLLPPCRMFPHFIDVFFVLSLFLSFFFS